MECGTALLTVLPGAACRRGSMYCFASTSCRQQRRVQRAARRLRL